MLLFHEEIFLLRNNFADERIDHSKGGLYVDSSSQRDMARKPFSPIAPIRRIAMRAHDLPCSIFPQYGIFLVKFRLRNNGGLKSYEQSYANR